MLKTEFTSFASQPLPLFEAFGGLQRAIPHIPIVLLPTPVEHAANFGESMGVPHFYVKREDKTHPVCGGNKPRGLEFLLGDAKAHDVRVILTMSSVGSHHICRTAWHARQLGIRSVAVVVDQPPAAYLRANVLTGIRSGATYVHASYLGVIPRTVQQMTTRSNWHNGRPPYFIPPGGTSPRSCLGHVSAAFELMQQVKAGVLPEPDYIHVPMGSLGTAAGLALGCKLAGLRSRIVGVAVSYRWYCTPSRTARLARRALRLMRRHDVTVPTLEMTGADLDVTTTALGEGYARFTPEAMKLAAQMTETQGLLLDGTYGGKALHGAMQFINARHLHQKVHLLWHTYHGLPCAEPAPAELEKIPRSLRRYFLEPLQPLDVGP